MGEVPLQEFILPEPWRTGLASSLFSPSPESTLTLVIFLVIIEPPTFTTSGFMENLDLGPEFRRPAPILGGGQGGKGGAETSSPKKRAEKVSKGSQPLDACLRSSKCRLN